MVVLADVFQFAGVNYVDAVVLALVAIAALLGVFRGASGTLARFLSIASTFCFIRYTSASVRSYFSSAAPIVSFAVALLCGILCGMCVHFLVQKYVRMLLGKPLDAAIGIVFSVFSMLFVVFIVFAVLWLIPFDVVRTSIFENSVSGAFAAPHIEKLFALRGV